MIVKQTEPGVWLAEGMGPLRRILAEGRTRREAAVAWARCYLDQWTQADREGIIQ